MGPRANLELVVRALVWAFGVCTYMIRVSCISYQLFIRSRYILYVIHNFRILGRIIDWLLCVLIFCLKSWPWRYSKCFIAMWLFCKITISKLLLSEPYQQAQAMGRASRQIRAIGLHMRITLWLSKVVTTDRTVLWRILHRQFMGKPMPGGSKFTQYARVYRHLRRVGQPARWGS